MSERRFIVAAAIAVLAFAGLRPAEAVGSADPPRAGAGRDAGEPPSPPVKDARDLVETPDYTPPDRASVVLDKAISFDAPLATPLRVILDAPAGRAFVVLPETGVEVLDLAAGRRAAPLRQAREPRDAAVFGNVLAVADDDARGIVFIDPAERRTLRRLPLGDAPGRLIFDAAGTRLFAVVGEGDRARLVVIDVAELRRVGELRLPSRPEGLALSADGARLFAAAPSDGDGAVYAVDLAPLRLAATWRLGRARAPHGVLVDEKRGRLIVACRRPRARLVAMRLADGALLDAAEAPAEVEDLSLDPLNARLYATGGEGAIFVYESPTPERLKLIERIAAAAGARASAFWAAGDRLLVAAPQFGVRPAALLLFRPRRGGKR